MTTRGDRVDKVDNYSAPPGGLGDKGDRIDNFIGQVYYGDRGDNLDPNIMSEF